MPHVSLNARPENVGSAALLPVFSESGEPQQLKADDLPDVHVSHSGGSTEIQPVTLAPMQLFLPIPRCYTSGDTIPLAIGISCLSSPALAKLYVTSVSMQLVKRRKIWVSAGRQISVRETLLSTAVSSGRIECGQGEEYLTFSLEAGAAGRESSWSVDGAVDVSVSASSTNSTLQTLTDVFLRHSISFASSCIRRRT